ncbi:tol-pal system YbgF family protein [Glaciecola siphonariae]|uniref:Tol-pal system YbgF family protein n=1 Tax=Glaciecola siphonariae TaxID=521012 RepID=A0ABV9LSE9_9ALTE
MKTYRGWLLISCALLCALLLSACGSINSITGVFEDEDASEQASLQSNELSEIERAELERLLSGKSSRASLASLNLMPQGRDAAMQAINEPDVMASSDALPAGAGPQDIPRLSLEEKRAEYEALLPLITDEKQRRQVAFRLADIKMLLAEQALEQGSDTEQLRAGNQSDSLVGFAQAIEAYQNVLDQHDIFIPKPMAPLTEEQQALNRKQMDAMYQLSRALDLSGQKERSVEVAKLFLQSFPESGFGISEQHIELFFRIGEYYFNRQRYAQAASYYEQVLSNSSSSLERHGQVQGNMVATQNTADFYGISAYMLGWSEFKQDQYQAALEAFDKMLKHTFDKTGMPASRLEQASLAQIDSLSKGEMRLVSDSIRVMALTFSYQGSGDAIVDFYAQRSDAAYQHLVFEELAQQYLDEDRYNDSADALLSFASRYPYHSRAVEFYVRHIDAYILGGFADKVLLAKQRFVETYALGGLVLKRLDSPLGEAASPYLKTYLSELAQSEHSIAQSIDAILRARQNSQAQGDDSTELTDLNNQEFSQGFSTSSLSDAQTQALASADTQDLLSLRTEAYQQAVFYYEDHIRTFSYDGGRVEADVPERRFYLAEAYYALAQYQKAIEAFEIYAYQDTPNPMAVEAAYAAILAHKELPDAIDTAMQTSQGGNLSAEQFSQQQFVLSFATDRRSPSVALTLMQSLFNSESYIQAQRWAKWLLEEAPTIHASNPERERSALLVMAHSDFALQRFASAEQYYRTLLSDAYKSNPALANAPRTSQTTALNQDSSTQGLIDRLAASLYMQAEEGLSAIALTPAQLSLQTNVYDLNISSLQRDIILDAIGKWQTIISDTPSSSFRIAAQYDSASYYALIGNWQQAIDTWLDFAKRYPNHELSKNIQSQLLFAYQQTEDWEQAADILYATWQKAQNSALANEAQAEGLLNAQDALYQAAVYYERANNKAKALNSFRSYAHAYPQPMDLANEARFKMSEFYLASGEDSKRRFWLNKLRQAQLSVASQQGQSVAEAGTPRSRYLAAMSAMVFAKDADAAFSKIKLTPPLNQSLSKKQNALTSAINAYDEVMSFAVADYVTQANYHLANLYMQLAGDLMNSSRPKDLSALELSQYELLLEEQAYPFEETAIELHENNAARAHSGLYDSFVKQSFDVLKTTLPARYGKQELSVGVSADDL